MEMERVFVGEMVSLLFVEWMVQAIGAVRHLVLVLDIAARAGWPLHSLCSPPLPTLAQQFWWPPFGFLFPRVRIASRCTLAILMFRFCASPVLLQVCASPFVSQEPVCWQVFCKLVLALLWLGFVFEPDKLKCGSYGRHNPSLKTH